MSLIIFGDYAHVYHTLSICKGISLFIDESVLRQIEPLKEELDRKGNINIANNRIYV